jgi:sulfur-oxidizing protein SoxY
MPCQRQWEAAMQASDGRKSLAFLSRRDALVCGASAAVLAGWLAGIDRSAAQTAVAEVAKITEWEEELARILKGATPVDSKMTLDVTEMAENGNTVPFSISVESPMTVENHVRAIHVLAAGNRQPLVGVYRLGPDNGLATVGSRMRLAQTQDIIAVIERSDGAFTVAKRPVKVGIACCGY